MVDTSARTTGEGQLPAPAGGSVPRVGMEIPIRSSWFGPSTTRSVRRVALVWAAFATSGILPSILKRSNRAQTLGLGAVIPGGGFFATKRPVRGAASLLGFVLSNVLWLVTGSFALPPLVWAGTAVAAVRDPKRRGVSPRAAKTVPAAVAAGVGVGLVVQQRHHRRQQKVAARRNEYLAVSPRPVLLGDAAVVLGPELSDFEVGLTRTLLDMALQPVESWDGYTHMDQFREAGLRYQLTGSQWAFSMQQFCRTPALGGYLTEAQRRMIVKHQERKIWSYWFFENLWGNFEIHADPIRRQNVMMSGFLGTTLGLYETTTHDEQFSEPGALRFNWSKNRGWSYGYKELADALRNNLRRADKGWNLSSCEPNWIFLVCNSHTINALIMHDRLHGTDYAEGLEDDVAQAIRNEFTSVDGRSKTVRSTRVGFAVGGPVLVGDATVCPLIRPYAPELADRLWTIARTEFLDPGGKKLVPKVTGFDYTDPGNYRRNPVGLYGAIIGSAYEVGDEEVAEQALAELLELHPPSWEKGKVTFPGASVFHHSYLLRALAGRRASYVDAVRRGMPAPWMAGPRIDSAPYPEVVVTRAVSDGSHLEAVLVPGTRVGRHQMRLGQLTPHGEYVVEGAVEHALRADAAGMAIVDIDVDSRAEIRVLPVA